MKLGNAFRGPAKVAAAYRFLSVFSVALLFTAAQAQMIEIEEPAETESAETFQAETTSAVGPARVLPKTSTGSEEAARDASAPAPAPTAAAQLAAGLETQPVALSNAMQPQTVPAAPLQSASAVQGNGAMGSALSAGDAGSSAYGLAPPQGQAQGQPQAGNLNHNSGSGQQIIIVPNLQNSPNTVQDQGTKLETKTSVDTETNVESLSRAELLRRERMRNELRNENRVLERLEEGRIVDERARSSEIERFETSVAASAAASASVQSVPVVGTDASAASAASASADSGDALAIASVSTMAPLSTESGVKFKVSPFGGYRWFENNNAEFRAQNDFVTGVSLEGRFNEYLGLEGSFSYGRDSFMRYGFGPAGVPYGAQFGPQSGPQYGPGSQNFYHPQCVSCQPGYLGDAYGPSYYQPYAYPTVQSRDSYEVGAGLKLGYEIQKIRPFLAAGIGGIFQKYAIDDQYTEDYLRSIGWSRSTYYVVSNFGGGLDFSITESLGLGARFDYQAFLNKKATEFNRIWGDSRNRYRLSGSMQLSF